LQPFRRVTARTPGLEELSTSVLIVGAGAAGLRAAIELVGAGISCLVVSRHARGDAHSRLAAGGVNAALGSLDPEDTWQIHAADTLVEGHHLAVPRAVELLARQAPERVRELEAWGCPFDRTPDGSIAQRFFGAQTFRRTCYAGDRTGEAILSTLTRRAEEVGVPARHGMVVTALATSEGRVTGAIGFDPGAGRYVSVRAEAVGLAGGGHAGAYSRSTSRAGENQGDAAALALAAGARLRDMELVQFHPTGHVAAHLRGLLVSEAARGEGGRLVNGQGERFMERYSPERLELDARDVVARAIDQELREGRGTERGGVWLDLSHLPPELVRRRLPKLCAQMQAAGLDLTRDPVEIAPTAHYAMGGVRVELETGATDVPGLFVVGEASSGLHGANRLGGNSLAETLVFGQLVGAHLAGELTAAVDAGLDARPSERQVEREVERLERLRASGGGEDPRQLLEEAGQLLWEHAGVIRTEALCERGLAALERLRERAARLTVGGALDGAPLADALALAHVLVVGEAILRSALARRESRGAHFRSDHPASLPAWRRSVLVRRAPGGELELTTEPLPRPSPELEAALHEPHVRGYHHLE
jgi:succinate dehydrogenase / fumarate reductase, flavoprotein subunit